MANPQIEDGRTEVANELAEALAKTYFNAGESRVLWAILRQTYGWHKKFDRISYSQFEQLTGMNRRHIFNALGSLIQRKIVTRRGNNYKLEYGLQKNYELWESLPIQATNKVRHLNLLPIATTKKIVTHSDNTPLPIETTKSLPIATNTKAKSNYTKAKDDGGGETFEKYKKELRLRFGDLDFDLELEKFHLYWHNGNRKLKNPRLALLNWLSKARKITKQEREVGGGTNKRSNRRVPKPEEYRRPDEY